MLTYRFPNGGLARVLRLLGAVVLTASAFSPAAAQTGKYLIEVGAAGAYHASATPRPQHQGCLWHLGRMASGSLQLSLEAEGWIGSQNQEHGDKFSVKMGFGSGCKPAAGSKSGLTES